MALLEQHQPVLRAAHGGDPAALATLLAVCQPDIRRYAQRNCLISDVDDAVQRAHTMIPVLKQRDIYPVFFIWRTGFWEELLDVLRGREGRVAARVEEIRQQAGTVFLVSHSTATVRKMCDRAIWIDRGLLRMDGPTDEVCDSYERVMRAIRRKKRLRG